MAHTFYVVFFNHTLFAVASSSSSTGALTGGLTLSTTLGLLYGLISASKTFPNLSLDGQTKMLRKRYIFNVVGTLGLAVIAAAAVGTDHPSSLSTFPLSSSVTTTTIGISVALAFCSGFMSFHVSYQFFQFPTMVAKSFADHKEVCLSWMDGIGYLFAAPVFAATGRIVPSYGWFPAWGMLSVLFACAGMLMMHALPPILAKEKELTKAAEDRDGGDQNHHQQTNHLNLASPKSRNTSLPSRGPKNIRVPGGRQRERTLVIR